MVDAVLLHEVESALLVESCEGWDNVDIMVQRIVSHQYHMHPEIVTGGKRYNFSSYPSHENLTIYVIMVVSCMQIRYPNYFGSQSNKSDGLVDSFYVQRIDVRGIALPFDSSIVLTLITSKLHRGTSFVIA